MQITIDTNDSISATDRAILNILMGTAAPAAAAKPAAAKAAKPVPTPTPEPDEDDDLLGGDAVVTMEDAVAAATKLVSDGRAPEVKAALAKVGARRVSEVKPEDLAKFVKSIS